MAVQTQIQTRRGTAATWTSTNPTLAAGEIGFESDTNKFKIGTGSTAWASLPYASNVSPLTTKGDLYTFSTTNARLAVGNNGESLVADSSTSTGLRYTALFGANKNKIINGDFYVNQRAFTSNTANNAYNFDRFLQINSGGSATVTPQVFSTGSAPVAGYEGKNFARLVTASQSASSDYAAIGQKIESVRTLAGQTATISFWAKASTGTPNIGITLEQSFGAGGSSTVVTTIAKQVISTSWARYSFIVTVPSISGKTIGSGGDDKLNVYIFTSCGSAVTGYSTDVGLQNATIDIWGVQVEAGSVATAFQTATGTIQGELAACQRYYQRVTANASGTFAWLTAVGVGDSSTTALIPFGNQVTYRVTPTTVDYGGSLGLLYLPSSSTVSSITLDLASTPKSAVLKVTATGASAGATSIVRASADATAFIGVGAEL